MEWKPGTEVPPLNRGHMREYVLAVHRSKPSKVYSFAAAYLNAYPLEYRHECPKGDGCEGIGCDDGCPTTGWFIQSGEDGDGSTFEALSLQEGDRIEGWRDIPRWEDRNEPAATISRLTAERDGLATQIDVLESNARIQAKLLADTGRQRNALVEAAKDLLLAIDDDEVVAGMGVGTGIAYRVSFKSFVERLRYAATSGLSDAPGHTDLMVTPESIDAWLEKNPLTSDDPDAQRGGAS